MPKFRKKPVEVEAVQFTGDNWAELHEFTGHIGSGASVSFDVFRETNFEDGFTAAVFDELHLTWVNVKPGQWIIRGVQGEFYPCDEDVFSETYDSVDSSSDISAEEPTEPGFYKYDGGAQTMIFLLDRSGEWHALLDNGLSDVCVWGYISQALNVWNLVKI